MKRALLLLLAVCLIALGFNTLDAMTWEFYYNPWLEWFPYQWHMTPTFHMEVWNAYFFMGILPLSMGNMILGFLLFSLGEKH